MRRKITTKEVNALSIGTELEIEGIKTQDDDINANALLGTIYLSKILPTLGYATMSGKKPNKKLIIHNVANALLHLTALIECCNIDPPYPEDVEDFRKSIPIEVEVDSVLTVTSMMGAFTDIMAIIAMDIDVPVWDLDELPIDFEDNILAILAGIHNLGRKYDFKFDDVLDVMDSLE